MRSLAAQVKVSEAVHHTRSKSRQLSRAIFSNFSMCVGTLGYLCQVVSTFNSESTLAFPQFAAEYLCGIPLQHKTLCRVTEAGILHGPSRVAPDSCPATRANFLTPNKV